MNIFQQYHFDDFTIAAYRELIQDAKKRFTFRTYADFSKDENFILWRHDVDFSVHRAYRLAQIESREGVTGNYFFLFHNQFYNLLDKEVSGLVKKIRDLGHKINLHFDSHYYGITDQDELDEHVQYEAELLRRFFDVVPEAFSFHNTNPFTMNCRKWSYGGLINTYTDYFQTQVEYCSDSNGFWRFKRMKDVINNESVTRMQALTHPEWWQETAMSPWEKIQRCIRGRADANLVEYRTFLENHKMLNVGCQIKKEEQA